MKKNFKYIFVLICFLLFYFFILDNFSSNDENSQIKNNYFEEENIKNNNNNNINDDDDDDDKFNPHEFNIDDILNDFDKNNNDLEKKRKTTTITTSTTITNDEFDLHNIHFTKYHKIKPKLKLPPQTKNQFEIDRRFEKSTLPSITLQKQTTTNSIITNDKIDEKIKINNFENEKINDEETGLKKKKNHLYL